MYIKLQQTYKDKMLRNLIRFIKMCINYKSVNHTGKCISDFYFQPIKTNRQKKKIKYLSTLIVTIQNRIGDNLYK